MYLCVAVPINHYFNEEPVGHIYKDMFKVITYKNTGGRGLWWVGNFKHNWLSHNFLSRKLKKLLSLLCFLLHLLCLKPFWRGTASSRGLSRAVCGLQPDRSQPLLGKGVWSTFWLHAETVLQKQICRLFNYLPEIPGFYSFWPSNFA